MQYQNCHLADKYFYNFCLFWCGSENTLISLLDVVPIKNVGFLNQSLGPSSVPRWGFAAAV